MATGSILVVDDEPGLLDVLEWELSSLGYEVLACNNGSTAVQVLNQTEFDAVISDVRMPGLSGIDVLKKAKEVAPDTEVIIATGYGEMETAVDCVRGGAFDFVQKPFNLPALMGTVERAVERKRLRASTQLFEASLAISANRDLTKLPQLIADSAMKILDADVGGLWMPSADGFFLAHRSARAGYEDTWVPLSSEAISSVAALGRPKLLPQDAGGDEALRVTGTCALVYPLMASGRAVGVLSMGRFSAFRPFRRSDVERASALASQVMLALENVRLSTQAASSERLATIGQLAAGVAHEINNPVSYVLMSLESAREAMEHAPPELRQELDGVLADALDGAGRIRDIVGDLKNMSRSDGTQRPRVDMNEVVRAALRVAGAELRHRAQVVRELGQDVEVDGDAGRLSQVLINLLVNAAHAMHGRPIAQNKVTVCTWRDGDHVRVVVRDNGPGIPREVQPRIFETFFTTKAPGVGTGLGLPISRDIARAHGGELELTSSDVGGTCFTVTLAVAAKR